MLKQVRHNVTEMHIRLYFFCNLPTHTHDSIKPTKRRKISTQPNVQVHLTHAQLRLHPISCSEVNRIIYIQICRVKSSYLGSSVHRCERCVFTGETNIIACIAIRYIVENGPAVSHPVLHKI